jgi:hypothetical protein
MSKEAMTKAIEVLKKCHYYMIDAGLPNQSMLVEAYEAYAALEAALAEQPAHCAPAEDGVCEALDCPNHTPEPEQPAQQEPGGVKFNEGMWQEREARIAQLEAELMRMQGRELKLQFALAEQPAQQHVSVTDELVDAYCKAWEQSFTADNPYDTVKMTAEDRKHIEVGLKAALAEQPYRQALQVAGTHPAPCARHCEAQAFEIAARGMRRQIAELQAALAEQPAQQEHHDPIGDVQDKLIAEQAAQQEPVSIEHCLLARNGNTPCPHTSTPAQRKPLTDEQLADAWIGTSHITHATNRQIAFARAIEAAHGIKENT